VLKFFLARFPLLLAFLSPFFFLGFIALEGASDYFYCEWRRI